MALVCAALSLFGAQTKGMPSKMLAGCLYVEFWGGDREITISLNASAGRSSGKDDAVTWGEDRAAIFRNELRPIWRGLIEIVGILGGWKREDLVASRIEIDGPPSAMHTKSYGARRDIVAAREGGIAEWRSFSAYLGLRDYSMDVCGVDCSRFDLWVDPTQDDAGPASAAKERDDTAIMARLDSLATPLAGALSGLVAALTGAEQPVQVMPAIVEDAGDYPYRLRVVIVEREANNEGAAAA